MTITYTWEVTGIKTSTVNDTPNVIVQTYWKKTGTDEDGNTGFFIGATPIPVKQIDSNFIQFENLQESTVLTWIQEYNSSEKSPHVDKMIQEQITEKRNQVKNVNLPWAPEKPVYIDTDIQVVDSDI